MSAANGERGEAAMLIGGRRVILRPSFQALVAAESELTSRSRNQHREAAERYWAMIEHAKVHGSDPIAE